MLNIIRDNSHNNDISVFYDNKKKKYLKISFTQYGNNLINNEIKGIKYFNKLNSKKKINYKLHNRKNYRRLEINEIYGKKIDYTNSFYKNSKYFLRVINFYFKNWPKKNLQNAHGDLTLDNVIFSKNIISIFDWENFKVSRELFFGYDLIYLLLSGIILPGQKKFDISSREEFKKIYIQLYNHKINNIYLNNPFKSIDKCISNVFTDILLKSPKKFITISIDKNFRNQIINFMDKEIFNK